MDTTWDVIVIGGSAAGLSAALLLGRSRRRVLVIDNQSPRNRFAEHMFGVLGHDGLNPAELVAKGKQEAAFYGVEFLTGRAQDVREDQDSMLVTLADGQSLRTRKVLAASGIEDQLPPIAGLDSRWGQTVLHCPYCHGWEVQDQHFAVLANSELAIHQAQLVGQWSDAVTLFVNNALTLTPEISEDLALRGVQIIESPVVEIVGATPKIDSILTADGRHHAVDVIFTLGDMVPRDHYLNGLELDKESTPAGTFITVDALGKTSHPHVWAAGNVVHAGANVPLAMGQGSFAAGAINMALIQDDVAQKKSKLQG